MKTYNKYENTFLTTQSVVHEQWVRNWSLNYSINTVTMKSGICVKHSGINEAKSSWFEKGTENDFYPFTAYPYRRTWKILCHQRLLLSVKWNQYMYPVKKHEKKHSRIKTEIEMENKDQNEKVRNRRAKSVNALK